MLQPRVMKRGFLSPLHPTVIWEQATGGMLLAETKIVKNSEVPLPYTIRVIPHILVGGFCLMVGSLSRISHPKRYEYPTR